MRKLRRDVLEVEAKHFSIDYQYNNKYQMCFLGSMKGEDTV